VIAARKERDRRASSVVVVPASGEGEPRVVAAGDKPFASRDGKHVYFAAGAQLHAVPITGGPSRVIATLPEPIDSGVDAVDGIHVSAGAAFRIVGGTAEPEGEGLVVPAPAGPWRARIGHKAVFAAPGKPDRELSCIGPVSWRDATHAGCHANGTVYVAIDLETGGYESLDMPWRPDKLVVAPGGRRWAAARVVPQTRLFAITNFAERPWAP
jgi:hypothetical protein